MVVPILLERVSPRASLLPMTATELVRCLCKYMLCGNARPDAAEVLFVPEGSKG